jgi:PAS domain S-box-containing protein
MVVAMSPRPIKKEKKGKDLCDDDVLRLSRLALDVSSDSCIWADRKGRIVYVNETACHALGYTKNELLSMKVPDINPSYDENRYSQVWGDVKRLGHIKFETVHMRKDGSRFPVAMTVNFLKLGEREYVAAFIRDITERKRAEGALRVSEESYRSLVESTGDWVWETDKNFILTYDSPKSRDFLGYEPDEVVGRSPFSFMPEDELERIKLIAWPVISRHEPIQRIENRLIKKDGSTVIIETTGVPLFDDSGHFRGYRGVNRDITDRKIAEDALQDARAQAELYLDLLGHDINNLHQIALGYLELAKSVPPGSGQGDYLDKSIEVLQRSTQLIKNVRKLQKLSDGVSASQDIDVCLVIAEMQREFGAVPGKTIMLNLNGHKDCYVRANELLPDLFANLVSNAIKHSGDRAEICVDLDVVKDKGRRYCRVMVEDDGPGIPNDFKGRIFNRMLRGTTKAKGMGLGLYLVKSLVESYEGKVWVEDRVPGDHTKGARFVVMLPAVEK